MKVDIRADWLDQLRPAVKRVVENSVASRLFALDSHIWGAAAQPEAAIRLGWVNAHESAAAMLGNLTPLRATWRAIGVKRLVLCGMGGSSLAPEVMSKKFGLPIVILDATSPDQVAAAFNAPTELAVVVASKSGSTVETDSHRRYALEVFRQAGLDASERMLVITDPESPLDGWARSEGLPVINADPLVGGRYSALTAFGLVPTSLIGANLGELVADAQAAAKFLSLDSPDNPAIWLAALMSSAQSGQSAQRHRDKLLLSSQDLPGLPDWVEQLVAESSGKEGAGTLPIAVDWEARDLDLQLPDTVRLSLLETSGSFMNSAREDARVIAPLGAQFLLWEVATAILGFLLEINPFDQPDVESAKQAARGLLSATQSVQQPQLVDQGCSIRSFNIGSFATLHGALDQFTASLAHDGYLAVLAFASRPEHPTLESLRALLALKLQRPVSFGWGPRYLHSTGQYHKGGPEQGAFLQIRVRSQFDAEIPGQAFSFGDLLRAQADGDAAVLAANGRPVLILEFSDSNSAVAILRRYAEEIES